MKLGKNAYDARSLPENYLPAAMQTRQRVQEERTRRFNLIIPGATTEVRVVSEVELGNPDTLMSGLGLGEEAIVYVGPQTHGDAQGFDLGDAPDVAGEKAQGTTYVAILDVGIVPWLTFGQQRFRQLSYLNLEGEAVDVIRPSDDGLSPPDVMQGAFENRIAAMARRFPGSVFSRGISAATPLHGTVMTDLVCGDLDAVDHADIAGLFGVELPASVLEDPSGGILQAVMFGALHHVNDLVRGHHDFASGDPRLEVVLPYGFTGGPHQRGHGFAKAADDVLQAAGFDVRLHLPMGNHREERFFARLGVHGFDSVTWEIPAFDASSNTIEFVARADAPDLRLALSSPDGDCELELIPGEGRDIVDSSDRVIGSYYAATFEDNFLRGRLCLAPTQVVGAGLTTPSAGDWQIRASGDVELWILRDDASRLGRIGSNNKQSRFFHPEYPRLGGNALAEVAGLDRQSPIKRRGSGSILAVAMSAELEHVNVRACGAINKSSGMPSAYSGIAVDGSAGSMFAVDLGHRGVHLVQATASGRKMRLRGTSVASALSARAAVKG